MADPKKPPEDQAIKPEEMTYPTPPLDPRTGAPLDTRFASPPTGETAEQPPKSRKKDDDEEENQTRPKSSEKPRRR